MPLFRVTQRSASRPAPKWEAVVHGSADLLLTTDVALGGLNRRMPQEKLDLFQLSTGRVA
jgi:hypothetical protein